MESAEVKTVETSEVKKYGVNSIIILLSIPLELGKIGFEIKADSAMGPRKWLHLIEVGDELISLKDVEWANILNEFKDMDEVENAQVEMALKEKFNIPDEKIKAKVQGAIGVLFKLEGLVKESINLFRN